MLAGIVFTLGLQYYSRGGVFFSGDGGLKALLAQQLARGDFHIDLQLPVTRWVLDLWQNGLYPFTPPYVYEQLGRYFLAFPFTFPTVSAPFYAVWGYRGLYCVPLLSLWILWILFFQVCRRQSWSDNASAIALVVLIFASPLSLYGAMYWEHTLAVTLAFGGLSLVLFPKNSGPTTTEALLAGSLLGLAVWFRPEFLCLAAILTVLSGIGWIAPRPVQWLSPARRQVGWLLSSMLGSIFVFFLINKIVYGHLLGIHAIQVVKDSSVDQQFAQALPKSWHMLAALVRYFPPSLIAVGAVLFALTGRSQALTGPERLILLICLLFAAAVPLIIPLDGGKQWGPRYYLFLVPLMSLVVAGQVDRWLRQEGGRGRHLSLGILSVLALMGIYVNSYGGTMGSVQDPAAGSVSLSRNYESIAPAIAALKQHSSPYVAMSHQFVAQLLWAAAPEKVFFRTESTQTLKQLAAGLIGQRQDDLLYICYSDLRCPAPEEAPAELSFQRGDRAYRLAFSFLGIFGGYSFYDLMLLPQRAMPVDSSSTRASPH